MSEEQFRACVEEAIDRLPEWVKDELVNVLFLVEDEPNERQRVENELIEGEILFGLYEGIPRTERGDESLVIPDTITLFKKSILQTYTEEGDIRECIENTVWHEVAHYFGHDEDWVQREEVRRGKMK